MNIRDESSRTLVGQVMQAIRSRIAARILVPGSKLPSIRGMAESMRVSKSTVVDAYDRLAAEGAIRSRPGSGFFVAGHVAPLSLSEIGPRIDRAIDPFWVSRQSLESSDTVLMPGCGWLPASWLPQDSLRRTLRRLARADDSALADYATPLGLPPLRQLLSRRLDERGIQASPDQILLTDSGTQAIDLLCRFLIEPGDTVLVDDPCYFNFLALMRAHRADVAGVPCTPSGPDVDHFARVLAERKPRLYITNSGLQNPTGASLSPVVTHRILKLAEEHDLTIIEDDIFSDFEYEPAPRFAAFDGLNRVIQISSFSKTLSSSLRCGYVAARREWIEELTDLKIATSFGGNRLSSELVFSILRDGSYRKHVEGLRRRLGKDMRRVSARLQSFGIDPWLEPKGGMFLWCTLPGETDAADMAGKALQAGIILAPGNVFSISQSAGSLMRFNVSQMNDPRIFEFFEANL